MDAPVKEKVKRKSFFFYHYQSFMDDHVENGSLRKATSPFTDEST